MILILILAGVGKVMIIIIMICPVLGGRERLLVVILYAILMQEFRSLKFGDSAGVLWLVGTYHNSVVWYPQGLTC